MRLPWFHKKIEDDAQLLKLEEMLRASSDIGSCKAISQDHKERMRAHIFARIDQSAQMAGEEESESFLIDSLTSWVKDTSHTVKLDPVKRSVIRERLYDLPEPSRFGDLLQRALGSLFFRRAMASVSVMGVFVLAVFAFALKVPVTFAKELTVFHDVQGSVTVIRDGEDLAVIKGFELEEGDTVVTGDNGRAVITYFDKSITRFFENTSVSLDALRSEDFGFSHEVSLNLTRGRVWSNVMDYVVSSDFTVKAKDLIASASKRATFSVSTGDNTASLQVFHNLVSVQTRDEEKTVVKGFQMVANGQSTRQIVEPLQLKEDEKQWVAANLVNDQQVIGEVEKGNNGVVAGPLSTLQENASLLLAFNDDDRFRLELNVTEKSFYERLKKDAVSPDEVKSAFETLQSVVSRAGGLKSDDSKKLAAAVMQSARNELLSTKPDSALYDLKIALEDSDLTSATGDGRLTVALDQASQFLAEAQDLEDKGMADAAKKAAAKYQDRMKALDVLLADRAAKKEVLATGEDALISKKAALERLYTAYVTPITVKDTMIVKEPSVKEPVTTSIAVAPAAPDDNNETAVAVAGEASSGTGKEILDTVGTLPVDDTQLPPKLQISRD